MGGASVRLLCAMVVLGAGPALAGAPAAAPSAVQSVLYGYKIGQPLAYAMTALGEPTKTFDFPDGWKAYAWRRDGHAVILEVRPDRPDLIVSIQVEGERVAAGLGLGAVTLGTESKQARTLLGAPLERRNADDLFTQDAVVDTAINVYPGFSFEEKGGKVTSIKVIFERPVSQSPVQLPERLLAALKAGDHHAAATLVSSQVRVCEAPGVDRALVAALRDDTPLRAKLALLAAADANALSGGQFHVGEPVSGLEYGLGGLELIFAQSFEGWVLAYIC